MMNKLTVLFGVLVAMAFFGYLNAKREGRFSVPDGVKAIECQKDSKSISNNVFDLMGTTLVMACQKTSGESWAKHWTTGTIADSDLHTTYFFKKQSDGRFSITDDALTYSPSSALARYVVIADIRKNPSNAIEDRRAWEMRVPSPQAFAAAGADTTFWCHDPSIHPQMHHQCVGTAQTSGLFWRIHIIFGRPIKNESGKLIDDFDMRPEVMEAYQFLAAHILKQV